MHAARKSDAQLDAQLRATSDAQLGAQFGAQFSDAPSSARRYFHWKKQKAAGGPCTDMAGFTRLCATPGGKPDGLEAEMETIFTTELPAEVLASHFHFGVLNRPNSFKQLFEVPGMLEKVTSPYVMILETDHVLMQPIPNLATESTPAAFVFGYMHAHSGQNAIIKKYWPEGDASGLQPVGPSPVIVHVDTLRKLTPRWLEFSLGLRSNGDAERVMQGWQEMWGYSIACGSLGIRHRLVNNFQVEHGALARHIADDFHTKAYIFHYTYGIEYRSTATRRAPTRSASGARQAALRRRPPAAQPAGAARRRQRGGVLAPQRVERGVGGDADVARVEVDGHDRLAAEQAEPGRGRGVGGGARRLGDEVEVGRRPRLRVQAGRRARDAVGHGHLGHRRRRGRRRRAAAAAPPAGGAEVAPEDQVKRCADCLFADFAANANHNIRFDLGAAPPTFKSVRVGDFEVVRGEKDS